MFETYAAAFLLLTFWRFLSSHVAPTYFPENILGEKFDASFYPEYLTAMEEPPLWRLTKQQPGKTIFRLCWIPSFHPAMCVKVVKEDNVYTLHAVQIEYIGPVPGRIVVRKTKRLSENEWTRLQAKLTASRFWQRKPFREDREGFLGATDGDALILEGIENGAYHVVVNSDPDADVEYEKLCLELLELTGLNIKQTWLEYHEEPSR